MKNKKKVVILALHMGYGGVENTISSKSSMLINDYDVEIVSLYKQPYKIPFNIDNRVKIKYLMNDVSNKKEFLTYLKKFNIPKIIKEGIRAIKILYNKNRLIKKYIKECNADVIISTRYSFTKLLNKYGKDSILKIHEQHVYDISDKYINMLNSLNRIDYIMPVSKYMYEEYKNKINSNKLFFIPLSLNYEPNINEYSKLNNKRIITIGRLDQIKGYDDLIKIMNIVCKKDKYITLDIFGDGLEKEKLESLVDSYDLSNNIKIWGYKSPDYIKDYLSNSVLYTMTSHEESFGLSVIEAMSYGIPCISFDSAKGCLELIKNSSNLVIKNRDINEYAKKILEYMNYPLEKKQEYSKKSIGVISEYKKNNVARKWLEFLSDNGE